MNTRGLILIIIGAMFECAWAFGLKHAQGPFEIFLTVVCVVASFGIFMLSFKYVGASIAYVVYTGLAHCLWCWSKWPTPCLTEASQKFSVSYSWSP